MEKEKAACRGMPRNIRHIITVSLVLLGVVFFSVTFGTQKASYRAKMCTEVSSSTQWSMHYAWMDGTCSHSVWLPTQTSTLQITVETLGGSLDLTVLGKGDTVFYTGKSLPTTDFLIEVQGKVRVIVEGKDHEGGFSIQKVSS